MKPSRTGLNLCNGANLPAGSHHSSASAENFATSAGSTEDVVVSVIMGRLCMTAKAGFAQTHGKDRHEIRRDVGRRSRPHPSCGHAGQARGRRRQPGRGDGLGDGRRDQQARRLDARAFAALRRARIRRGGGFGRAGLGRADGDRAADHRRQCPLMDGLADPGADLVDAQLRAHRADRTRGTEQAARRRRDGSGRGLPGHRARQPHHHHRPRRRRHLGGRGGGGAQGRPLRHLYRRRRRLYDRPAHRRQGTPPGEDRL